MIRSSFTSDHAGFSVVDLLVTLAITALFAIIAIPQYRAVAAAFARDGAVQQIEYDIRRAKAEAVSRSVHGVIEVSTDGETCTVGVDLVPFASPPEIDEVISEGTMPSTTSIETADNRLIFDSRGFLIDDTGAPITGTINFNQDDQLYAVGTIYSTGVFLLRINQ